MGLYRKTPSHELQSHDENLHAILERELEKGNLSCAAGKGTAWTHVRKLGIVASEWATRFFQLSNHAKV
jgi:hypothetical protein